MIPDSDDLRLQAVFAPYRCQFSWRAREHPWADFRSTKAAVKAHTIVDLRGSIPVFVHITTGKVHDFKVLDLIRWPAGSIVVVDRGYLDFARLQSLHQRQVSFVIRAKDNTRYT